jgi:hypothetical protein
VFPPPYNELRHSVWRGWILRFQILVWIAFAWAFMAAPAAVTQTNPLRLPNPPVTERVGPEDEPRRRMERDMAKRANLERQADLKRDTEKLLKLATELKESVDKTTESTLSLEVVKRAEEIEKLAHSVKEKMKGRY